MSNLPHKFLESILTEEMEIDSSQENVALLPCLTQRKRTGHSNKLKRQLQVLQRCEAENQLSPRWNVLFCRLFIF